MRLVIESSAAMMELGRYIGELCQGGERIYLRGELGTGKTTFVKGLALGLDIKETITSASFVLLQIYQGRLPLYHLDLYRINSPVELSVLALEDAESEQGVTAIEWADLFLDYLEAAYLDVNILYHGETREVVFTSYGNEYLRFVQEVGKNYHLGL